MEQRRVDRVHDPDRFDIKPTIAERALRRPPPQSTAYDETPDMQVGCCDSSEPKAFTSHKKIVEILKDRVIWELPHIVQRIDNSQ